MSETETKEVAMAGERSVMDFRPTSFEQALKFCEYISKSDLVPLTFRGKPADIFTAIQYGAEIGLGPMQSLRSITVINGRPTMWGDLMLAKVQAHPEYEWHNESESTDVLGVCVIKRKGLPAHRSTFSVADAKRAGLWEKRGKDGGTTPWITYPTRMLKMRARGFAMRDTFADALGGIQMAEEAMDMPLAEEITEPIQAETGQHKGDAVLEKMKRVNVSSTVAPLPPSEPSANPVDTGPGPDFHSASQWINAVTYLWDEPERAALATGVLKDEFKVSKTAQLKPEQRSAFVARCRELGEQKGVKIEV